VSAPRRAFDHLRLTVGDVEASAGLYVPLLELLGHELGERTGDRLAWRLSDGQWLILTAAAPELRERPHDLRAPGFHHLAFAATSRAQVKRAYELVRDAGAEILDAPAEYDYEPGYYAVFFRDPGGLKLEVVHTPERPA
jgi:glyoxylase I family protein